MSRAQVKTNFHTLKKCSQAVYYLIMKIVIGLSGGVDSAVSAYLLKQAGHEVIALFMKNWDEEDCPAAKEFEDVVRICDVLDIPYYSVNFVKEYWDAVFSHFLDELKLGYTPNPDILCNREIKFNVFFNKAMELGADFLATGHYCQTKEGHLLKGADPGKDQSYFLYTIKKNILKKTLFPIGSYLKSEVREIAKKANLPVFDKKDSTGICFIGKRNFKDFIQKYIPAKVGEIIDSEGNVLGTHEGAIYYTIGQRKGLGIGGPGDAYFVVGKDIEKNHLIVAQGTEHPALFSDRLTATEASWVHEAPLKTPYHCRCKIRYRQEDRPCVIENIENDLLTVSFPDKQRAVTPRQSIVFYDQNRCLGGAMILKTLSSF